MRIRRAYHLGQLNKKGLFKICLIFINLMNISLNKVFFLVSLSKISSQIIRICSMKKIPLLVGLILSSHANSSDVTPYIVNGTDISASKYPSFVSLFYDRLDYDGIYGTGPYCGGTLLDDQHVLTAAHCVYGDNEAQLFTSVVPQLDYEYDFPYAVTQRAMVSAYYYPSTYNDETLEDDIAILKLASPITAVSSYADLAQASDETNYRVTSPVQVFMAIGHGNTETGIDLSSALQETQLKYVENADCHAYSNADTSDNLCMTGAAEVVYDNAVCQGDSGGPLFWGNKQVGITSFGPQVCGDPNMTPNSVFTEVSHHYDWIQSVLSGNEAPKVSISDAQRNSFLNPSSGGGGGSLGWLTLGLMVLFGFRRSTNK